MVFATLGERQLRAAHRALEHIRESINAPISVRLWDGSVVPLGPPSAEPCSVAISGPGVIGSLIRRPTLENLLREYALGHIGIDGEDLIRFGDVARTPEKKIRLKSLDKLFLRGQVWPFLLAFDKQTEFAHDFGDDAIGRDVTTNRKNQDYIQFHYDLGNEFYALFLGEEMQYSCAYFKDWSNSLDQAQHDKLEMICRKLRLRPGDSLLDVGCGWGGLICHAARHYGVTAHGVTLSQTQLEYTQEKIRALGLENQVRVELRDFTTLDGTYDKIASVGMFEHVGIANLPAYFRKLYSLLRDRGILLNHGIARRAKTTPKAFHKMRPEHRFIAKYIFPGGELDHIGHAVQLMESSKFEVHDVEGWREHYAMTTRRWCLALSARRDEAIALIGPEKYRLWLAYLAGVSFAFRDGSLRIFQVVASKHQSKGSAELPQTREDLYAA